MKYYEFFEPYYALMQAESEEEVIHQYLKYVSDEIESAPEAIDRDRAFLLFARGLTESGETLTVDELLQDFNNPQNQLLLIDGSLL